MKILVRWAKFNVVGAMGMVVQLAALAVFNRWMHGHYLWASAAAIELTLLHNFAWHVRYTWRDRRAGGWQWRQLMRFHLSNGLVSMLGNLVLMRLLIHRGHVPLLEANLVAIMVCSVLNFCLSHHWAFSVKASGLPATVVLALLFIGGAAAHAQTEAVTELPPDSSSSTRTLEPLPEPPRTPVPVRVPSHPTPNDTYLYHVGVYCGLGASTSPVGTVPTTGCGVGLTLPPTPLTFEFGLMAPQANRSHVSGYISVDGSIPLARSSVKYLPMAIVGFSRLFETGHALDYGVALAMPRYGKRKDSSNSLRLELRDYWTFANPAQHNVMLRIGWMSVEAD